MDGGSTTRWMVTEEQLARLRLRLIRNATMFDDPTAYQAGVEDTLEAVLRLSSGDGRTPTRTPGDLRSIR